MAFVRRHRGQLGPNDLQHLSAAGGPVDGEGRHGVEHRANLENGNRPKSQRKHLRRHPPTIRNHHGGQSLSQGASGRALEWRPAGSRQENQAEHRRGQTLSAARRQLFDQFLRPRRHEPRPRQAHSRHGTHARMRRPGVGRQPVECSPGSPMPSCIWRKCSNKCGRIRRSECGALYHAVHGLQLYRDRRFGHRDPAGESGQPEPPAEARRRVRCRAGIAPTRGRASIASRTHSPRRLVRAKASRDHRSIRAVACPRPPSSWRMRQGLRGALAGLVRGGRLGLGSSGSGGGTSSAGVVGAAGEVGNDDFLRNRGATPASGVARGPGNNGTRGGFCGALPGCSILTTPPVAARRAARSVGFRRRRRSRSCRRHHVN